MKNELPDFRSLSWKQTHFMDLNIIGYSATDGDRTFIRVEDNEQMREGEPVYLLSENGLLCTSCGAGVAYQNQKHFSGFNRTLSRMYGQPVGGQTVICQVPHCPNCEKE
jgi:hypothetical protein